MGQDFQNYSINKFIGGSFTQVNHSLIKLLGLSHAVWLSFLWSKWVYFEQENKLSQDGFFYLRQDDIYSEINIPRKRQTVIIQDLVNMGFLEIKKVGVPSRNFYRINALKILETSVNSRCPKTVQLDESKSDILMSQNRASSCAENGQYIILNNNIKDDYIKDKFIPNRINYQLADAVGQNEASHMLDQNLQHTLEQKKHNTCGLKQENPLTPIIPFPQNESLIKNEMLYPEAVKKKIKEPSLSKDESDIVSLWEGLGLMKHRRDTKTFKSGIKILRQVKEGRLFKGTLFEPKNKQFTNEEIKKSITQFALAATSLNYYPKGDFKDKLKKWGFESFFYQPMANTEQTQSQFLFYLENEAKLIDSEHRMIEDECPGVTRMLKEIFCKKYKTPEESIIDVDLNWLRKASKMLVAMFLANRSSLVSNVAGFSMTGNLDALRGVFLKDDDSNVLRCRKVVDLYFEFIRSEWQNKTISPKLLASSYNINKGFPQWLLRQGVFSD